MIQAIFAVALVFTGIYAAIVGLGFIGALARRSNYERREREAERVRPEIAQCVIAYAAGADDIELLRTSVKTHCRVLEDCLVQFQATLSGEGRHRLSDLALDLGLVHKWCLEATRGSVERRRAAVSRLALVAGHEPSRRISREALVAALSDNDDEVQLEAARTLAHFGRMQEIVLVFGLAVREALIVRIILVPNLRPYALALGETAIPDALSSTHTKIVLATLEIIAAWERALPLPSVPRLVDHPDTAVRIKALRVIPLTPASPDAQRAITGALYDPSDEVCIAAAYAAERLRLESAVVGLARCMRQGRLELARAAASALAMLPPRGWQTLEESSRSEDLAIASAAAAALEAARKSGIGAQT